jgi:hypothetical protein
MKGKSSLYGIKKMLKLLTIGKTYKHVELARKLKKVALLM